MQILGQGTNLKVIRTSRNLLFLLNKLPLLQENTATGSTPIDLVGLGTTGVDKSATPWLVTCATTRRSYILFEGEVVSKSYVAEKFNVFEAAVATDAARCLQEILASTHPQRHQQ